MMSSTTLTAWIGAAIPILLLMYLLIWLKWSAVSSAAAAAALAILTAMLVYRAPLPLIFSESCKGLWSSVSIIAVTITAILLYEVSAEVDGFSVLQRDLTRLIPDRLLQVLTLGWCFPSFLQGPSGFGVPIAVTAPLLIGIGVKPFWAVAMPLMAHAWANTFGTLALGWDALVQQTVLADSPALYAQTALWTGALTGLLCLLAGITICFWYNGIRGLRHGLPAVGILGAIQAGGQLALCTVTPTLCTVIPTTLALGAAFLLARTPRYVQGSSVTSILFADKHPAAEIRVRLSLHEALLPYTILILVSVFVLLIPGVNSWLGGWKMSFSFPETSTGYGYTNKAVAMYAPVSWFTHSAFFLVVAALLSWLSYSRKGFMQCGSTWRIARNTAQKSLPASLSAALLLVMSKVMGGSGQIDTLAHGTAMATGPFYVVIAPLVGTLGSFISASNVSSNILFGPFQESMADLLGKNPALMLAAQTGGAALGTMFSPSKVLLGTTTAGRAGQEGAVIKQLLGIGAVAAAIMGAVVLCFA